MLLLEREVGVQLRRERAGEAVRAFMTARPSGTSAGRTRADGPRSTLRYRLVDSGLAWPSTAEIVGSGTAARSSRDAALWRSRRVPAFTSATPASRNTLAITRWIAA